MTNQPHHLLQTAISLNNEGAYLLQAGDQTMNALQLLRRAIRAVRQVSDDSPCDVNTGSTSTSTVTSTSPPTASSQTTCFLSEDDRLSLLATEQSLVYMHRRPLIIPTFSSCPMTDDDHGSWDSLVQTTIVYTLFNTALACHLFGLESGHTAPLRQAVELYNNVVRVSLHRHECCVMHMAMIQCLALNNLVHLYYDQCDYDGSAYYMSHLRQLILDQGIAFGRFETHDELLTEMDVEEVKLNVLYWRPPSAAQAA